MKLSDFGLCKPLDCSILQEKDFVVAHNLSGALQSDGRPVAPRRTRSQMEQLQNWQRNRRMLVSLSFFSCSEISTCQIEQIIITLFILWKVFSLIYKFSVQIQLIK